MERERWRHHLDYLTSLLGYSMGSGSLVKFPYLCMRNGGGAFLLPYIFFTFVGAIPCVFLEMVVGQFSQSGSINVWNMCPPFKGIGVGVALVTWMYLICYLPVFAWFMYYFYHSFLDKLPWDNCDQPWNTPACVADLGIRTHNNTVANVTHLPPNAVINVTPGDSFTAPGMTAAEEFWRLQVLQMTDGLEHIGGIRWPLVGCMAVTCVVMFLFAFKGIKVSGKVVYITVGVPLMLILVFLVQGCLLPGSADGIYYYVYPKFEKLRAQSITNDRPRTGRAQVTAAAQDRDAILSGIVDMFGLILTGFAFFAIMGHVAYQLGVPVEAFESSGFSLAFIVYPQVVTHLPLPHVWSVLTFLALMTLEIDSLLPGLEIMLGAIEDAYSGIGKRRSIVLFVILLGGIYIVTLVDWYNYFPAIGVFAMLECFVVSWCYVL
ncbi:sodium- and chloride-dependent taurine transporter-like [Haliotis rubra]|uniref:sodium- and chloride-dependent taurine transporter-like n=1 Tax=Haliotis rubra TaxID=36100 RepID=UPI001EE58F9B|nr:sodium- and chloride-dependent taurine transporter-like [Haliotis rubra]